MDGGATEAEVSDALSEVFDLVNGSMNNYDPQSLLGTFNRLPAGQSMVVDWDFAYVLNEALRIGALTEGAYDVTLTPLMQVWGFAPGSSVTDGDIPDGQAIDSASELVGSDKLRWKPAERELGKTVDGVGLDLSSIAKGYAVDIGADALDEMGIEDYLFEIGGEVRVAGHSPRGDPWRIAVERPDAGPRGVQAALSVSDVGVATSGDYRNFFMLGGQRYSHLIDPRTGWPIRHDVVSVTVVHPSTMLADAWATALIILGSDAGMALAEARQLAVYMISRDGDELTGQATDAFSDYLLPGNQ
jgi:thiamine biosynthesis lipoprotein